ncbi:MAG: Crp/Fnr family transcriptional regulator [Gammaproteobacteria bacterium]
MNKKQQKLLDYYQRLPAEHAETLLAYAEFMAQRFGQLAQGSVEMQNIPRPEDESVVAAIKRLSATYPMLDKTKIFHDTSSLMAQHILHGKAAVEVIDELEALFQQEYNDLLKGKEEV